MTPLKRTRILCCNSCEHRKNDRTWEWPRCLHPDGAFELNDTAFDGPDSDCPGGHWKGLDTTEAEIEMGGQARSKCCHNCEHLVMKAGFLAPRCRAPGNDIRLGPEVLAGPDICPTGRWKQLDDFQAVPKRFADKTALRAHVKAQNAIVAETNRRRKICDACANTTCAINTCRTCRRNALLSNPGMVCPETPPKWGPVNVKPSPDPPRESIRVVWTISAWNEPLLKATVESLYASITDPHIDFDVVVVDDGSTDGCADGLTCPVIRNETPLGIGYNLNVAADYAIKELGADVVGVADAHMKIPPDTVGILARRAMEETCTVCSHSRGYEQESKTIAFGAYLVWKPTDSVEPKWVGEKWPKWGDPNPKKCWHHPREEWAQVQVLLGAFYAYSRETIQILKAPTGRLWETVVGRWGALLAPFSLKCLLMGVPAYVSRDVYTRHMYRRTNPLPNAHVHKVKNIAFSMSSVLSPEVYEEYFHKWCWSRGGISRPEITEMEKRGRKGVKRPWTPKQERELLDALPKLDAPGGKKEQSPIPVEKIWLCPPRDKLMRSRKARTKQEVEDERLETADKQ